MSDAIRLFIVTNNPMRALGDTLGCATTNKPKWCRVVSDPIDILQIVTGSKCIAAWYGNGTSAAEYAWRERRLSGGIVFLADEDWQRLSAWIAKQSSGDAHRAAEPEPVQQPAMPAEIVAPPTGRANLIQQFT
jgi:hypothetical protein